MSSKDAKLGIARAVHEYLIVAMKGSKKMTDAFYSGTSDSNISNEPPGMCIVYNEQFIWVHTGKYPLEVLRVDLLKKGGLNHVVLQTTSDIMLLQGSGSEMNPKKTPVGYLMSLRAIQV